MSITGHRELADWCSLRLSVLLHNVSKDPGEMKAEAVCL